jgi:predicted MFS family arabinose efflux permease
MGHTYGVTAGHTGFVAVATQIGYAVGLLAFVPLGDVLERRGLMMRMYGTVAVALLLVAMAPSINLLIAGSVLIGMFASVTHVALPIAPDLVSHEQRGRAIGTVMTGLLLGILLARTFSGWVSGIHGWRWVFVVAAVMNAFLVLPFKRVMPKPAAAEGYSDDEVARRWFALSHCASPIIGALGLAAPSCF